MDWCQHRDFAFVLDRGSRVVKEPIPIGVCRLSEDIYYNLFVKTVDDCVEDELVNRYEWSI